MIIFQLTLSGHMLRTLVSVREQTWLEHDTRSFPDHFISSIRALERERLITHESPCNCNEPTRWIQAAKDDFARSDGKAHFHMPGRKHAFEITEKGELALRIAAQDLSDFLVEVQSEQKARLVAAQDSRKRLKKRS